MGTVSKKDLAEHLRELTVGLFALEVNTILKANMTGERWSSTDEALRDLRGGYEAKLVDLGARDKGSSFDGPATVDHFAALGRDADHGIAESAEESARLMLARIRDNCRTIQRIMGARDPGGEIGVEDFITLRKIWEIGAEEIVMQTVVHLDGDVMTRVQPRWAGPAGHGLLAIHNTSVATATSYWRLLVDTLRAFVEGAVAIVK